MDYHQKETHTVHFLCTYGLLSTTRSIFIDIGGDCSLGISFRLRHRINNGANKQTEQQTKLTGFATAR